MFYSKGRLMIPPAGSRNRVAEANRIAHKGGDLSRSKSSIETDRH